MVYQRGQRIVMSGGIHWNRHGTINDILRDEHDGIMLEILLDGFESTTLCRACMVRPEETDK